MNSFIDVQLLLYNDFGLFYFFPLWTFSTVPKHLSHIWLNLRSKISRTEINKQFKFKLCKFRFKFCWQWFYIMGYRSHQYIVMHSNWIQDIHTSLKPPGYIYLFNLWKALSISLCMKWAIQINLHCLALPCCDLLIPALWWRGGASPKKETIEYRCQSKSWGVYRNKNNLKKDQLTQWDKATFQFSVQKKKRKSNATISKNKISHIYPMKDYQENNFTYTDSYDK